MASFPCNTTNETYSPPFPAGPQDKKNIVLDYLATSARFSNVGPASRLEVRPKPEMASAGIAQVDALTGGLPRGCLSEICGSPSSGKTSMLLAAIAAATGREESCVLIDASDSFDPESGEAAGIDFAKLLWVRCGKKFQSSVLNFKTNDQSPATLLSSHTDLNPCSSASIHGGFEAGFNDATHEAIKSYSERRLGQVLKTTDLVLQSGGFGLVVLDLAGIPEKFVRRIPLASWFRFQRAVENTKTVLLVISEVPCAQTCASLVLELKAKPAISYQPSGSPSHAQLLEKMQIDVELARTRLERKPMKSVKSSFATRAVRAG
jgi:hypothetical protein